MSDRFEIQILQKDHRRRLEDFLCDEFQGLSKMYLREVIKCGQVQVNGRLENRGFRVRMNDFVEIEVDISRETAMLPEPLPLEVLYEDRDIIVVNKAAGMLAHPSFRDRNGTLLNGLAFYLNQNGGEHIRPGLIHRLDKLTSGLMVVSKTLPAHRTLAGHFQRKLVKKRYMALVDGVVAQDVGSIEAPIGRFEELKFWGVKDDGKPSVTNFWVHERRADSTILELEPVTGRTNQLRIHCASIGHAIIGDVQRGGSENERLCLHAWKLSFRHPSTRETMEFESPVSF